MAKTYKELKSELEINSTLQDLLDDLDLTEQDYEELLEGKKTKIILRVMALAQSKRLATQVKKVKSTSDLNAKMDELAKAVAIIFFVSLSIITCVFIVCLFFLPE